MSPGTNTTTDISAQRLAASYRSPRCLSDVFIRGMTRTSELESPCVANHPTRTRRNGVRTLTTYQSNTARSCETGGTDMARRVPHPTGSLDTAATGQPPVPTLTAPSPVCPVQFESRSRAHRTNLSSKSTKTRIERAPLHSSFTKTHYRATGSCKKSPGTSEWIG